MKKILLVISFIFVISTIYSCTNNLVVNFKTLCNLKVDSIYLKKGNKISDFEMKRAGFTFNGWYDETYTNKWDFQENEVLDNMTLYASWTSLKEYRSNLNNELGEVLEDELYKSFLYFYQASNTREGSGFGLARDRYPGSSSLSSIAATGYALAALPIGVKNGWITFEEGRTRAIKTMQTVYNLENYHGFFAHFLAIASGKIASGSEISVIDTGLLVAGALLSGRYFGNQAELLSVMIYERIDWDWYVNKNNNLFYMSYNPLTSKFSGAWDRNNEQLLLYFLGAGSPTYPTGKSKYESVMNIIKTKKKGYTSSKDNSLIVEPFYINWDGPLFTHQFSHAYLDFRNLTDPNGINWFHNATSATKAQILYANDMSDIYKGLSFDSWGLSASDGPNGYSAYGSLPSEGTNKVDGTVAPYAAIASINYTPEDSKRAANHFSSFGNLIGEYGFKTSYNLGRYDGLGVANPWYAADAIGIDKGVTVMMLENYQSNLLWNIFMDIDYIKNATAVLEFS